MIYLIDGTGRDSDLEYEREFEGRSHLTRIRELYPKYVSLYSRGPYAFDLKPSPYNTDALAGSIVDKCSTDFFTNSKHYVVASKTIVFAGYSRGGAAAIMAAHLLNKNCPDIKIDHLVLIDPVARTMQNGRFDLSYIPSNVVNLHRIVRDKTSYITDINHHKNVLASLLRRRGESASQILLGYHNFVSNMKNIEKDIESTHKTIDILQLMTRNCTANLLTSDLKTIDFGNCGLRYSGNTSLITEAIVSGSHGAMGGVPFRGEKEAVPRFYQNEIVLCDQKLVDMEKTASANTWKIFEGIFKAIKF